MNFSTECLEHLRIHYEAFKHMGFNIDAEFIKGLAADLTVATKFLIPSPGGMNVVAKKASLQYMKLPYPICAFEYSCPEARYDGMQAIANANISTTKSSKRIALAYDCSKNVGPVKFLKDARQIPRDSKGILIFSLYYLDDHHMWSPSFAGGYVDADSVGDDAHFLIDQKHINLTIDAVPFLVQNIEHSFGHLNGDNLTRALLNDIADEVGSTIRACLLLNTRNLKVVKVNEAPVALNKKRAKNGKPPFFEYKTLDIFVSKDASRLARKRVDPTYMQKMFANMHTDRRWGTVRGHFKHRSTGIFWWSDHTRGSRETGMVEKVYQVKQKR